MRKIGFLAILVILAVGFVGCGETIRGVGKDAMRIGRGTRMIFVGD